MSRKPVVAFAGGPPRLNEHIGAQLLAAGYALEGEPTVVLHSVDGPFAEDAPDGVTTLSVGEEGVDVQRPFTPRQLVRILDERLGSAWRGGTTPMGESSGTTPMGEFVGTTPMGESAGTTPMGESSGTTPMGESARTTEAVASPTAPTADASLALAQGIVDAVPTWAALTASDRLAAVRSFLEQQSDASADSRADVS